MALLFALVAFLGLGQQPGPRGYFRYPAIRGETIVFTAQGDLWRVGIQGGEARQLTTHPGEEIHAAISPDGGSVAFAASYEGPVETYVMDMKGGLPRRLTWHGETARPVGWTPDGRVLCTTGRYSTLPSAQLVAVDPKTLERSLVPLAQASDGCYDPAGATLFFTRLPFQGSHAKRYKGGTAQNLWKWTGTGEAIPLTQNWPGTSKQPGWSNGRVFFLSDRDGTMNLWSMRPDGGDLRQHTRHAGWDIRWLSVDAGRAVYQLGADLHLHDLAARTDRRLSIQLTSDLDQLREKWVAKPMEYLTAGHLSPEGDRVVLTARGQVFVAPAGPGRLVEATRRRGVRYRSARFSHDGKALVVLSDESGETEWWRLPANGVGEARQLSTGASVTRFDGLPSPDGRWIAFGDKNQDLWLLSTADGATRRIAQSPWGQYGQMAWSPDSRWLAYVESVLPFDRIFLHSVESGRSTAVTSERCDSHSPSWSPDGRWLYFLSDRTFRSLVPSPWGPRQPEPFFDRQTRIYALALRKGLRFPFQPPDELHPAEEGRAAASVGSGAARTVGREAASPANAPVVEIDLDGIQDRLHVVPVPAGNYEALAASEGRLLFLSRETGLAAKRHLQFVEVRNRDVEAKTLVEDVAFHELSADAKKLLVRKGDTLYVLDAGASPGGNVLDKKAVDLSGWSFALDPREEWRQMYREAWRLHRDYFYDRNMHGVDWPAMRRKYEPLVDRVTDRGELSDVLAQLISELSALHAVVRGGDFRRGPDSVVPASLGAELERDPAAGGWRVARIYRGDPDDPESLSPLARPGVEVREGDVVVQINGRGLADAPEPEALLRGTAGRQVLLRVRPRGQAPERDVVVVPLNPAQARDLRYTDWELSRRERVERLGGGQIGYVHLRAMGTNDMAQFARDFYPVFMRQGLIVDVRHNGGGNIDSWVLEKLMRKAWFYWQPRVGNPHWNMQWAFRGHMVVLCDEHTGSDGEAFTEGFRRLGLGKVIGTRTWGGEIWLSASNVLVDRGIATAAELGVYGPEGAWLIEGHGVDPDIVVDNLPHATYNGEDAQLQAAVEHLRKLIREKPVPVPRAPRHPDKSR